VWENKHKSVNADLVFCHGINDYGGKFSEHANMFLEAGYRIGELMFSLDLRHCGLSSYLHTVVPDMPSHGRSTGLHAYVTNVSYKYHNDQKSYT
jgi:acylglycerol lipase